MEKIIVPIIRHAHGEGLPLPFYATLGSVGLDLFAAISEPISLAPGHRFLVVTGISISLPPGYEGQIRSRSGLALKHGISVLNSPGTIDWDYRGEIKVILINQGHESFLIERETRIAQLIIAPVKQVIWQEVSDFETLEESGRGEDGFGSTGLKKVV